jgi:hypothetical protein
MSWPGDRPDEEEDDMAVPTRFCAYCGAPLPAGAQFCGSCGQRVVAAPTPQPAAPPVQPSVQVVYQVQPPAQPAPPAYARPRPRFRLRFGSILLLIVGVLLVLLLLTRFVALQVVGQTTIATVTAVEPTGGEDYEYRVSYTFAGPGGTAVSGAAVLEEVLDISVLPQVGAQVTVRYLPFWPAVNEMKK